MRILVVEDNRQLVASLQRGLEENGYAVDTATDGETALDKARSREYDIVLLDRMLPKIPGDEVCQRLRTLGSCVPILMLTARVAVGERVKGLDLGADDYLTKPFAFAELMARMRALLRRPEVSAPPVLKVQDLELDPVAHLVRRSGNNIALSAREFALLEYLLRNTGRVLGRVAILDHVWGDQRNAASNMSQALS